MKLSKMKKQPLNLHIPSAIVEAAREYAESNGESLSSVVRRLLAEFLDEQRATAANAAKSATAATHHDNAA
jgi:hypothetical protein